MMDFVQFSVIVNHLLPEVVSHLDQIEEALTRGLCWRRKLVEAAR